MAGDTGEGEFGFVNLEKPHTLRSFAAYADWAKALHFSDPKPEVPQGPSPNKIAGCLCSLFPLVPTNLLSVVVLNLLDHPGLIFLLWCWFAVACNRHKQSRTQWLLHRARSPETFFQPSLRGEIVIYSVTSASWAASGGQTYRHSMALLYHSLSWWLAGLAARGRSGAAEATPSIHIHRAGSYSGGIRRRVLADCGDAG